MDEAEGRYLAGQMAQSPQDDRVIRISVDEKLERFGWSVFARKGFLSEYRKGRQVASIDLRGVRGEMLVLRCPGVALSRPIRLLHPRVPIYLVPRGEGIYMLGATMIESDRRGVVTARSVLELLSAAYALHPGFGEAEIVELGADARPAFPDNLPRVLPDGVGIALDLAS